MPFEVAPGVFININETITASTSIQFTSPDDNGSGQWLRDTWIDLTDFAAVHSPAMEIKVITDNKLTAFSESGTSALITKDLVVFEINAVPEPGTALLLALGAAAASRRRTRWM